MRREITTKELRWIDITDPDEADVRFLRDDLRFHSLDVAEVRKVTRHPEVEPHPTYLFLVVQVPLRPRDGRAAVPAEVDIFVEQGVVVTAHAGSMTMLDGFFRDISVHDDLRERMVGRGPAYLLYSIMDHLFDAAFPILDQLAEKIEDVEQRIFSGQERQMVTELSAIQRDLQGFRSIVRPQRHLYETGVLHGEWDSPAFRVVFRSLHGKLTRLWERLETLWERAQALAQTNDTLSNHKLNEFLKLLTVLGALFIPFGLVAQTAVFINASVPLPNRIVFWGIIGSMLIIDFVILWRAKVRNLL